jgi:hypothetical protein
MIIAAHVPADTDRESRLLLDGVLLGGPEAPRG